MVETDTEKKLRLLSLVKELHHSIGVSIELEKVCSILSRKLRDSLRCEGCEVLLFIEKENEFFSSYTNTQREIRHLGVDIEIINGILKAKLPTGETIQVSSTMPFQFEKDNTFSLIIPILIKGEPRGIIHLYSKRGEFTEEALDFMESLMTELSLIIERSLLYESLKVLTIKDSLTGAFNRRKLDEDLRHEILRAVRYNRKFSILMIDIDWFKNYNDFHGHVKGDELLRRIVKIISKNIRSVDRLYRYGGEEFIIILFETDREGASKVAEKIRYIIGKEYFEGEEDSQPNKKITVSIGVTTFSPNINDKDELIREADLALYESKKKGGNSVCVFSR